MKHFISAADVTDIDALVAKAIQYKNQPQSDKNLGAGKRIGLVFLNPSLRTRISTQIAAQNLGMEAIVFNIGSEGWALEFEDGAIMNGTTVEHIKDAAPVLGQYFDILGIRTFPQLKNRDDDYSETIISAFKKWSGLPIVSLESSTLHPLQSLADAITIKENCNNLNPKVVLCWAPHVKPLPQCVPNSFAQWMSRWNAVNLLVAHPKGYDLSPTYTGGAPVIYNQEEALLGADFVYVKAWSSFQDYGRLLPGNEDWMLNNKKWALTANSKIMHCLPVRRNVELSDELLDGPNSIVTQQAANRVWAAQAVLASILQD